MTSVINAERLVSTFMELCVIDAEPTRERAMADRLTALLGELGFVVTKDDAGVKLGGTAGNLYATLTGAGSGKPTWSPIKRLLSTAKTFPMQENKGFQALLVSH
ncbi:MAG: hypothetical protein RW306_15885 [Geobacteraceae bacterium]|nr:hypothetical protein [Geobacteraceae bacterium]